MDSYFMVRGASKMEW